MREDGILWFVMDDTQYLKVRYDDFNDELENKTIINEGAVGSTQLHDIPTPEISFLRTTSMACRYTATTLRGRGTRLQHHHPSVIHTQTESAKQETPDPTAWQYHVTFIVAQRTRVSEPGEAKSPVP